MISSAHIVLQFVFQLAILLFVIRFLLQASGADFYNPISQTVVKGSDPLCKPIRMLVPSLGKFDLASMLVAWLVAVASVFAIYFLIANQMLPIGTALWVGFIKLLLVITQFYKFTIIIIVIASFLAQGSIHPALALLNQLLEPVAGPIRKIMPDLGMIDFSPMLLFLIIIVIENTLSQLAPGALL